MGGANTDKKMSSRVCYFARIPSHGPRCMNVPAKNCTVSAFMPGLRSKKGGQFVTAVFMTAELAFYKV